MNLSLSLVLSVILVTGLVGTAYAQTEYIPAWVKEVSGFWAEDKISDTDFINAIEFLIDQNVIKLDNPTDTVDTDKDTRIAILENTNFGLKSTISDLEKDNQLYLSQLYQYKNKYTITPESVTALEPRYYKDGSVSFFEYYENGDLKSRYFENGQLQAEWYENGGLKSHYDENGDLINSYDIDGNKITVN